MKKEFERPELIIIYFDGLSIDTINESGGNNPPFPDDEPGMGGNA